MLKSLIQGAAGACLLSGAAYAADLPSREMAPVAPILPAFTWTGFYAGTLTGYNFGDKNSVRTSGNTAGTQANVAAGFRPASIGIDQSAWTSFGVGIGYDYQFAGTGFVAGVTADGTWMDNKHYSSYGPTGGGLVPPQYSVFRQQLDWMATARGRIGYAFDRFLVYGTGGVAFGKVNYKTAFFGGPAYVGRFDDTATGYVYGGGVEYAIPADSFLNKFNLLSYIPLFQSSGGITVKAEVLHYDLGTQNVLVSPVGGGAGAGSYTSRFKTEGNIVRGGFTYRFNGL